MYKFILTLLPIFFFLGCGESDNGSLGTDSTNYSLKYNATATSISGDILFDMGTIPTNHTITLTSFIVSVPECQVTSPTSAITPTQIYFTSDSEQSNATLSLALDSVCSSSKLLINAKYKETSVIDGKTASYSKDVNYELDVQKTSSISNYTPALNISTLNVTNNSQTTEVIVSVYDEFNRLASSGSVNVIYPSLASSGADIGTLSPTTATISDGKATFVYTAPANLNDANFTSAIEFYYNDDVTKTAKLTLNFSPEPNQLVNKNYEIKFTPQDNSLKMSLEELKSFSVAIADTDGAIVKDADINELNVSIENSYLATLKNSTGATNTLFTYDVNNITAVLQSKTLSGLVPLHVSVSFKDVNGDTKLLNNLFNVIVESGPPTAISISYVDTDQDKTRAKFIERFAVSVTDKYFNPVNTNPSISVGAIVGYARNKNTRIYEDIDANATLNKDSLELNATYKIDMANNDIDINNDVLVTFGSGYTYPASGVWSFTDFNATSIILAAAQYDANETSALGYAIGRNFRQDACNLGDEWLGQVKVQDGALTLDSQGTAIVELSYDYYLVGKDVVLYINIIGQDNSLNRKLKIGEAKKHTLRGHGLESFSEPSLSAENGANNVTKRFYSWITDTPEAYRNARFSFNTVTTSGLGHINSVTHMPIEACSGHSYIEYSISADVNETFSITVADPKIISEF